MKLLILILLQFNSYACIWDSDTLKMEAEGLPSVVDTITGHFKTYPKSYYQFRIDRLKDKKNKSAYEFDDLAVAYDRIGDNKKAIEIIEFKQSLDLTKFSDKESKDIKYRTLANLGTFQAHLWFRQLKDQKVDSLLDQSIETLIKAIELNPDAHFGREKVQLDFIKWMKSKPSMETPSDVKGIVEIEYFNKDPRLDKTLKGLQGLIVLGEAWQSPDVFISLSIVLANMDHHHLSFLARLRAAELIKEGKNIIPTYTFTRKELYDELRDSHHVVDDEIREVRYHYFNLKESGVKFQNYVKTFIDKKISSKLHPDISPDFWLDFHPPKKYEVYTRWVSHVYKVKGRIVQLFIVFLLILFLYRRSKKRQLYRENLKL